jgi:hypothetical protein
MRFNSQASSQGFMLKTIICKLQTLQNNQDMLNTNACGKPPCANDPLDWQHGKGNQDFCH